MSRALAVLLLVIATAARAIPEGPAPNTPEWYQRELMNFAKVGEAPAEQLTNPDFVQRWQTQSLTNVQSYLARLQEDPSWNIPPVPATNTGLTPLCASWSQQCTGDPFRYLEAEGADGKVFYETEAEVVPVVYYDEDCARISGRVWAPRGSKAGDGLPAVVIENGSVQAPETLYWWAAQALVRAGYVVMTFDPRGQGRSDNTAPDFSPGSNFGPEVFWNGLVNAIDFFRSTSAKPYPHNVSCEGSYPTVVTSFNPLVDRVDPARLGIAGHSLGATGVSIVQGYGAEGADPWPGLIDSRNPVKVAVAWDGIATGDGAGGAAGPLAALPEPLSGALSSLATGSSRPAVVPRVPMMGQNGEYGLTPAPFLQAPDPEQLKAGYSAWTAAGLPVFELTIQGSTHYEWSLLPSFPATSWCPEVKDGRCEGGWGNPLAEHYTVAWFDRWLKKCGEPGYLDADRRLLADTEWRERYSFYFRSGRNFKDRGGTVHVCEDIRDQCTDSDITTVECSSVNNPSTGGDDDVDDTPEGRFGGCALGSGAHRPDPLWAVLLLLSIVAIRRGIR